MADPPQVSFDTSWSTWLAVIVGLLAFLYWKGVQRYNSLLGSSPLQGPRPLPWVGNLLDVFKYGGIHKMLLNYFYKYGRVYKMCIGRSPVIVVSDPEILKQILVKEFWKFPNRPPFAKPNPPMDAGLFVARDERWKRIRKTLTPTFTATKLKQIVPIIESSSEKLTLKLQKFAETGERVDVVNEFSLFALDVVMRAAFGMDSDIQMNPDPVFVEKAKEVFKTPLWIRFFSMFPFWDYLSRYVSVLQNMDYFVVVAKDLLNQRKEHGFKGSKDLVQLMLKAHEEHTDGVSKLSDSEITAQSVTFLVAGFETTGSTLTSTAYFLATHPEVQDRLIREIDELMETSGDEPLYEMVQKAGYMDQVFSEVLRICSPGYTLFRECADDTIYKGIRFPKGCDVNIPIYALHRDPELWENPWEFNPDNFSPEAKERRDQFAFLPFGVGPRQCIGIRLAMLEIKIGLLKILQGFKFERAPETVKKLEHHAVLLMAPKETIYVKIKAR